MFITFFFFKFGANHFFMNETIYIQSAADDYARLQRIESIIVALELQMLSSTANEPIQEYSLDDGQVKIRTMYRSIESMQKGIFVLEQMKNRLLNSLNGHQIVIRPWQGLINRKRLN